MPAQFISLSIPMVMSGGKHMSLQWHNPPPPGSGAELLYSTFGTLPGHHGTCAGAYARLTGD